MRTPEPVDIPNRLSGWCGRYRMFGRPPVYPEKGASPGGGGSGRILAPIKRKSIRPAPQAFQVQDPGVGRSGRNPPGLRPSDLHGPFWDDLERAANNPIREHHKRGGRCPLFDAQLALERHLRLLGEVLGNG